jgi:3-deoxy-manno-octulosonate cytidylyltransferase (CMP-KDO synthetase)
MKQYIIRYICLYNLFLKYFFDQISRNSQSKKRVIFGTIFAEVLMKVIGIIPARFQSSRFPGKMLAPILGKSVIQRTYESAKCSKSFDKLVIATDDLRIYNHAKEFGAPCFITSATLNNGTERLVEAYKKYPELRDGDILVNVQGDRPCVTPASIDAIVDALKSHPEDVIATPVVKIESPEEVANTASVKCVFDRFGYALYFSRSPIPFQKNSHPFYKHIGVYAFRKEFLLQYATLPDTPLQQAEDLEHLKVLEHGYKIRIVVIDHEIDLSVDYPSDIKKVEKWLCR